MPCGPEQSCQGGVCVRAAGDTGGAGGGVPGAGGVGTSAVGGSSSTGGFVAVIAPEPTPTELLAGDIVFSPPSQTFQGTLEVSLSAGGSPHEIRYTLDGSVPTATSPVYSAPLSLTNTTQVRAQPFENGTAAGALGTAVYLARSFDVSQDLPILVLDNYGGGPLDTGVSGQFGTTGSRLEFVDAIFMQFDGTGGPVSLSSTPDIATRAGIHVRGQSTASFDKTPLRLELRDNHDEDADWPVLGMPAESDWALRGPFADKALIRDAFFYGLGADMGIASPRFAFAELYLNVEGGPLTQDDYMGVYLVVETIKNAKNRLDLKQLREDDVTLPDITGGYIFRFEWRVEKEDETELLCTGSTNCWAWLYLYDPNCYPNATPPSQLDYITQHIQELNDVLHSPDFADPATGYPSYLDVDSVVDQVIVNELGRELDSYIRSAYFYKDRNDKIFAGPLWDYNLALGVGMSGMGLDNVSTSGWQYEQTREPIANDWIPVLMTDPEFVSRLAERWRQLRQGICSDTELDARIDALAAPLVQAAQRNFERWDNLTSPTVGPFDTPTDPTWEGQLETLRSWLHQRVAWLDSQW